MIAWLLRALGVHDERPEPVTVCAQSASERRYEQTRAATEQAIRRANQYLVSWEDLYDPSRRRQ